MFPTAWSNSLLRRPARWPLTAAPTYAGGYCTKDEASIGAARLGGGPGMAPVGSVSTGTVTNTPPLLRRSMDQQFQRSSAFLATSSTAVVVTMGALSLLRCPRAARFRRGRAPTTSSGRRNDRDRAPHRAGQQV